MKPNIDYSLYFVTPDVNDTRLSELLKTTESLCRGGVTLVQLRDKTGDGAAFYDKARKIKSITDRFCVPLIINDRVDIALAVDADGVHVGQEDIPAGVVRRLIGDDKLLGVSAKTLEEAGQAETDGADYLGAGSVFPTSTKSDAESLSLHELETITHKVDLPVVAIGGIQQQNLQQLRHTHINGVAVVSALYQKDNPEHVAREWKQQVKHTLK
ncbi:thiamine phosphate synthase [Tuberibacillus sp. Marseille-P3662]|uniref:thiamine phosphate synthase n=1 Tax=Tuberibacillus sp. Marseille-P3662 TaxID=1965358 RepID=UPI000A1CCCE7|nr:thiamine phosphate synthase [Tuberibacillus sp. Marseille-P3662]